MRSGFEAHLMKFGPGDAVWYLPDALTVSITVTSAFG